MKNISIISVFKKITGIFFCLFNVMTSQFYQTPVWLYCTAQSDSVFPELALEISSSLWTLLRVFQVAALWPLVLAGFHTSGKLSPKGTSSTRTEYHSPQAHPLLPPDTSFSPTPLSEHVTHWMNTYKAKCHVLRLGQRRWQRETLLSLNLE